MLPFSQDLNQLKTARKDFIVLCVIACIVLAVAVGFDLFDRFAHWYVMQEEPWEIEEFVVVIFILSFCFALFSYRRWKELALEVLSRQKVEEALKEQTDWLQTLMHTIPNPVFYVNSEGKYTGCNRAFEEFTGQSSRDIVGRDACDMYSSVELTAECRITYEELLKDAGRQVYEGVAEDRHGELRDVIFHKAALSGPDGRVIGLVGVITDISERKRSEIALAEESLRRRILFEQSRDGIVVLDGKGKVFEANQKYADMLGYTLEEVQDLHVWDWDAQWTREELEQMAESVDVSGDFFETRHRRKDGTVYDVEISTNGAEIAGQKLVFCVCRDITQRKAIENELRESDAFTKAVMENLPIGVAVNSVEPTVEFIYMNDNFARLYRTTKEDLTDPDAFWEAVYQDPQFREEIRKKVLDDCASGDPERMYWGEVPITREGEDTFFISARNIMVPNRNLMISIVWDVTERKIAEDERRRLEERLQRAEKMEALGTMAGGVAHDLNNVLGIVVGYSELLVDDLDSSSHERMQAMEILKGGQRAAAIVQDLLTLARRGVQSWQVVNLNHVLAECRGAPENAMLHAAYPDIQVRTDLDPDLLDITGSPVHLSKSFMNLVANAAEAMDGRGVITVKTRNQYLDKPVLGYDEVKEGDYVVLSVSDTGEGISPADLNHIFEPFYTKKVMGRSGTGLGLAVVWGTVKDHEGYINVETEQGRGTTFTLYFPVTRQVMASGPAASPSVADYMGRGESILVVDDVKEQRDLATAMLEKLNYRVTSVSSGEAAVEYVKQHEVDLIVLDMIMEPGMDGLDTYSRILQIRPGQKAVIVSGFAATERVNEAQSLGAGAYVKKPYILKKLGLAVSMELGGNKR